METGIVGKCFCGGTLYFDTGPLGESRGVCDKCHTFKDLRLDANCDVCGRAKAEHPIAPIDAKRRKNRPVAAVKGCNLDYRIDAAEATPLPFALRSLTQDDKNEIQQYLRP